MLIDVNKIDGKYEVTPNKPVDDNKEVTIDVSEYVEPVEVTSNALMRKATVTLSNIPSGVSTLYAFVLDEEYVYYSTALDLNAGDKLLTITITGHDPDNDIIVASYDNSTHTVTDINTLTYQYDSTKNISL